MHLPIGKKYSHYSAAKLPKLQSCSKFQWNLSDKIDQYWVEEILHLECAKYDSERIVKNQQLTELRQKVKETKFKLNELKVGDVHKIKNLLKGYKSSVRSGKSLDKLLEHCDGKLFTKRRELDRLNYEMNQLSSAFASKLTILNKMQNRQKYSESYQLAKRVKNHAFALDKSEIQIRNLENLLNDFKSIRKYLATESLHCASTLKLLENEINEQNTLLNLLKKVNIPPVKRSQIIKKRILDEPNKRQTSTNGIHTPDQNIEKRQSVNGNTDIATSKFGLAAKCVNVSTKIQSIAQRIQSKLVTGQEKINIRKNQLDGLHGKIEKPNHEKDASRSNRSKGDVHEAAKQDDLNKEQSTLGLQAEQNHSSKFERISGELAKMRGAMQRFDDLLRNKWKTSKIKRINSLMSVQNKIAKNLDST